MSGGGYRGLFTSEILARLEDKAGKPIGQCFDMIAGTSIGGIIAMGLALGVQQQLVDFMMQHDLKERYIRFDQTASVEHLPDIGLDVAEDRRRATQLSLAEVAFRAGYANPGVQQALAHTPSPPPHLQWAAD